MIFLLDTSEDLDVCHRELGGEYEVGQLITPLTGRTNAGRTWALDNGAFSRFDEKRFLALMERDRDYRAACLFVCSPDVVGSALRTSELFSTWEPRITAKGWKVALVAQDGIENLPVPWDQLDAIFIGGSTRWKCSDSAMQTAKAAKAHGKWVHVGRCNTSERFDRWREIADSMDGSGVGRYSHMRENVTNATPLLDYAGAP